MDKQHEKESQDAQRTASVIMLVGRDLPMAALAEFVASRDLLLVTIKRGAESALDHLRELNFDVDLVVTDMELAQSNGAVLTMSIRDEQKAYGKDTPIVWATYIPFKPDDLSHPIVKAANLLGITRVLAKPYDAVGLIEEFIRAGETKHK